MSIRSAGAALGFSLLLISAPFACTSGHPLPPGAVIVRSEQLDDPKSAGVADAPADGKYACYKVGIAEPLETFRLLKGQALGFQMVQTDIGRGRSVPALYGVAGKDRFVLPIGDKYVWKRL